MKPGTQIVIIDAPTRDKFGAPAVQPGLPGRWSVWAPHPDCPGAHTVVPADATSRGTGIKWAVVRITQGKNAPEPFIQLRFTEPSSHMPAVRETRGATR